MPRTREVSEELSELREDFAKIKSDLGDLAKAVIDLGKNQASATGERLSKEASRRWEQLQEVAQSLSEGGGRLWGSTQEQVREHMGTSLITAFGLGFALGKLVNRRSGRS